MVGEVIVVNGFCFCQEHGEEYCHHCWFDHRPTNNYNISDKLQETLSEEFFFDTDGRSSINCFNHGAVKAGRDNYRCTQHRKVDCGTCFDWEKLILEEARQNERDDKWLQKRAKAMDRMDL